MTMGGPDVAAQAAARSEQSGSSPQAIVDALARIADADTRMAVFLDYGRLFEALGMFLGELPEMEPLVFDRLADLGHVPLTAWVGGTGTQWAFGMDFDMSAFGRMMKALTGRDQGTLIRDFDRGR